jgi:EmrB/QacA subfamily drug resistance transporter
MSVAETPAGIRSRSRVRGGPGLTLFAVTLGVMMVGIDGSVVAVANPYIGKSLHTSLSDLQWVTNSYLLVIAVTLILGGKLGDTFGRRRIFLLGVLGFGASSVGIGLIGNIDGVIALRCVQGAFGALLLPNTLALLRAAFPDDQLNRAVGIWASATATATAAGPVVGGLLVEHISWQSVFYLNVPIGLVAFTVGAVVLAETRESVRQPFDFPGIISLALGLLAFVYGLVKAQSWGWGSLGTLLFVLGGLAAVGLFVVIERTTAHPFVPLRIFRNRSVLLGTIAVTLDFFALLGMLFFISLYLQNVHGYSPVSAGFRTLPLTAAFAISSPLGARLTNRFGPWLPITVGLAASAIALFSMTTLQVNSSYIHLWPPFLLLGLGIGMVVTAATDAIVGNTPVDDAGVAGGIQTTAIQFGGVLGTAVCGSVLAAGVGHSLLSDLRARGVSAATAHHVARSTAVVSQGLVPGSAGNSTTIGRAIQAASHASFMSGLHEAMLVAAIVALAGAALGPFVRSPLKVEAEPEAVPAAVPAPPVPVH